MKARKIVSLLLASSMLVSMAMLSGGCTQNTTKTTGAAALWEGSDKKNKIVVISDIHIGIDDKYAENVKNRAILIDFLKRLQTTKDVSELVIDGDFLDEWFLPVDYPSYTDVQKFYKDVVANNKGVIDELNNVANSGIKLVYIPGNHDMTQENEVLQDAIPKIVQVRDAKGLGTYYTGDRKEVAIEHGHRYDVFSAPDTVTNAKLCGNDDTILPAGYFYARYAATWVLEGRPKVEKKLPEVTKVPDKSDKDQYGAYLYYSILKNISTRMTPKEDINEKIFKMHMAGFDNDYTYLDFFPAQQADGRISAPVLFQDIQRTWAERQKINQVKVPNDFLEAVSGTLDWNYYYQQAKTQNLENSKENVDVVVFGHTHVPAYHVLENGKYYVNDGTWIDHNTDYPEATRTFAVITTGEKTTAGLYKYEEDGSVVDISESVNKEKKDAGAAEEASSTASFDIKSLEKYGDEQTQARYVEVGGLKDSAVQEKLNKALKEFCLSPTVTAGKDTTYDIMPVFEVVSGNLLSMRTYNTAYTKGAAYPVSSIQTQLFNMTTGEKDSANLWSFIKDKAAFQKLIQDRKVGFAAAGVEGALSEDLKKAAYQKLAESIESPELSTQFFFGDGGRLNVWCEGQNHATGDYWLFDVPVTDLESMATDKLLPIIEDMKKLSN